MDGSQEVAQSSPQDTGAESIAARNDISNLNPDSTAKSIIGEYSEKQKPNSSDKSIAERNDTDQVGYNSAVKEIPDGYKDKQSPQFDVKDYVTGEIDNSPEAVKAAREKYDRYVNNRLDLKDADGNPLPQESSDLVVESLRREAKAKADAVLEAVARGEQVPSAKIMEALLFPSVIDERLAEILKGATLKQNPDSEETKAKIERYSGQNQTPEDTTVSAEKDEYVPMPEIPQEIQDDPMFKSMREAHSLDYLKTKDAEWFKNQYPSDVLNEGFLTDKDGNKVLPSNNLSGLPWNIVNRAALEEYAKLYPDKAEGIVQNQASTNNPTP